MAAESENIEQPTVASKGPGIMGLVKAVAIITVVVIAETVAASMFFPSARETEKLGKEIAAASKGEKGARSEEEVEDVADEEEEATVEVLLGTYNVTRFNPESRTTLTVDVEVYVAVLAEEEADFTERFEQNKGRVGEQIVMTMHAASSADLIGTGLDLIKRKILEKTNRALGKPLVREVLFPGLNFVER